MSTGVLWLIGYLLCGIVALGLFDIFTGRLRRNWNKAVVETMTRMSDAGAGLSTKACMVLFAAVMWLFWPMVLYGAARDAIDDIIERRGTGNG